MDPNWYIQYLLVRRRHQADVARAERSWTLKRSDDSSGAPKEPNWICRLLSSLGALLMDIGFRLQARFNPQALSENAYLIAEPRSIETHNPC